MPMTRELKKRFIEIEDRLGKVENKKGVTNVTNVSDPSPFQGSVIVTRLDMIEAVLMMPGPKRESGQIVSGYAEIVDQLFTQLKERLDKIDSVLQIPGTQGKLSDWREVIEKQIREFQGKVEPLFNVGKWIDKTEKRLLETEGELKIRRNATSNLDGRLEKLERTKVPDKPWMEGIQLRLDELERKPLAGPLSNIAQKMEEDIQSLTKSVKTLKSRFRVITWLSVPVFVLILLTLYLV